LKQKKLFTDVDFRHLCETSLQFDNTEDTPPFAAPKVRLLAQNRAGSTVISNLEEGIFENDNI
jgi:hypothetical protein